ncbi:MAG: hypothetical protein ABR611_10515, partial [Chthoniobacterales bacterium]
MAAVSIPRRPVVLLLAQVPLSARNQLLISRERRACSVRLSLKPLLAREQLRSWRRWEQAQLHPVFS